MTPIEFAKMVVLAVAMFTTVVVLDDLIENIIVACKTDANFLKAKHEIGQINIFPVGLSVFTIILWTSFYALTLL